MVKALGTRPHFTIYDGVEGEDLAALETIRGAIETSPDFVEEGINLYGDSPEAVGRVIDFLHEHPEGMKTLVAWRRIAKERLDGEIEFDPTTEEKIEQDPYFQAAKKAMNRASAHEVEYARQRVRIRRWKIFIDRVREDNVA